MAEQSFPAPFPWGELVTVLRACGVGEPVIAELQARGMNVEGHAFLATDVRVIDNPHGFGGHQGLGAMRTKGVEIRITPLPLVERVPADKKPGGSP